VSAANGVDDMDIYCFDLVTLDPISELDTFKEESF
jgi:hypothetical protein